MNISRNKWRRHIFITFLKISSGFYSTCRVIMSNKTFCPIGLSLNHYVDLLPRHRTTANVKHLDTSCIVTSVRHQCSSLNADLSKIHIMNNFKCNCGASFEDAIHYFLECPLYLNERRTLLSNCDVININIETLLFGNV